MYRLQGEFCANHPWEVIVATFTLASCLLTIDSKGFLRSSRPDTQSDLNVDIVVMTGVRCVAILYCYYQFKNLRKIGSTFLGVAGIFTVISSFVFSSTTISCLGGDISEVKDALFCFLLLIDLSKATKLAQFALSGATGEEVKRNIAKGLAVLGPSLTLDTLVETLLISVGTISGLPRLELLCYFACVSVIVNYLVFMSFYPACLSLVLELYDNFGSKIPWDFNKISEDEKPNPVLQRVKVIMSAALGIVHLQNRWTDKTDSSPLIIEEITDSRGEPLQSSVLQSFRVNADQVVVLILLLALTVKFMFFEDDELAEAPVVEEVKEMRRHDVQQSGDNRSPQECLDIFKRQNSVDDLRDEEIEGLIQKNELSCHMLEKYVQNKERAVKLRRIAISAKFGMGKPLLGIPFEGYDYAKVFGACCENVIGYVPMPLGLAGPLILDGEHLQVPMATTEGCLVASTNRGCRAVAPVGIKSRLVSDGMTRGPVVRFPSLEGASSAMRWLQDERNFEKIKTSFDSTSRFAKLTRIHAKIAGRLLFVRFVAKTGDAMGMNMVSKGTEAALGTLQKVYPEMELLSLSGNYCSDKKPAAVNWIEGRGKYVVCEAIVPSKNVQSVLKTSVSALVDLNVSKNLIGSAMAGSIGGFNAHAANLVTAIFIATGQDPAQVVSSSNCITLMEPWGPNDEDLYISCTMPSIEVGTVGGGTQLPAQSSCLQLLGVQGADSHHPGSNAAKLARIVCATVLAGELSLMSALAAGHLVKSHLKHNRSAQCLLPPTS